MMNHPVAMHAANTPAHVDSHPAGERDGMGGGLYLDAYETSFPYQETLERPSAHHLNQGQQALDEPMGYEVPSQYSPFMLISNLRTHLYVSLEKNTWLQKRIEDLEEERNFLRCQLDRFIANMKTAEVPECPADSKHGVSVKTQPASPPPVLSPMITRSGKTLNRVQNPGPGPRRSAAVPVKQEVHLDEDNYYEDEYMEEEESEDSSSEKRSKRTVKGEWEDEKPRMKMRRIFRITQGRERQRVKDPDGVLLRYQKILTTYQRVRSMSRAFNIHGVDRNTMASTSPIAELLLVAPEKLTDVGEFEASKEKLLDYARRCYKTMDEQTHTKVQTMKKTHQLLPISYRFRN